MAVDGCAVNQRMNGVSVNIVAFNDAEERAQQDVPVQESRLRYFLDEVVGAKDSIF